MNIAITKVTADQSSYLGRYTVEILEDLEGNDIYDVDAADVPDRIREALIDWALGDPICEECAAEHEALNTEADTVDATPAPYSVDDLFRDFNARCSGKDSEEHAELDIFGDPIPRPTDIERYLADLIRHVGQVIKDPQARADFYKDIQLAWDKWKQ